MKLVSTALLLCFYGASAFAQQTVRPDGAGGWVVDGPTGCSGLFGAAQGDCIAVQQQQLTQQKLMQQQQLEQLKLQNELLRQQLTQQQASAVQHSEIDLSQTP